MNLNKKQIFETTEKIKNGIVSKEVLKELLGGERLDDIFDSKTQEAIFDSIIKNGKLHNMIPNSNGLDILDGLLKNQVSSNLSDFYMIKPDYILQLSPEQQRNMANSISGGRQDLSLALQNLWGKGIRTEACSTKSSDNIPMLQLNIKEKEIEKQYIVQQLYEQSDINGNAFYDYQAKDFSINLSGNNLYNYLQEGNIPLSQIKKPNIFEEAIKDSLQFAKEMCESYSLNGIDTTELKKKIISERNSLHEISNRIESNKKQGQITGQEQYNNTFQHQTKNKNLPAKQNRFSRFFSLIRERFARQNRNNTQRNDTIANNSQQNEYGEQQNQRKQSKKKIWKLKPQEKARIQNETVKVTEKYRKQEEYKNGQNIDRPTQQQISQPSPKDIEDIEF